MEMKCSFATNALVQYDKWSPIKHCFLKMVCLKKYSKEILKKFQMEECKAASTPMNQREKFIKKDGADKG